jgi:hypothetical protein
VALNDSDNRREIAFALVGKAAMCEMEEHSIATFEIFP